MFNPVHSLSILPYPAWLQASGLLTELHWKCSNCLHYTWPPICRGNYLLRGRETHVKEDEHYCRLQRQLQPFFLGNHVTSPKHPIRRKIHRLNINHTHSYTTSCKPWRCEYKTHTINHVHAQLQGKHKRNKQQSKQSLGYQKEPDLPLTYLLN